MELCSIEDAFPDLHDKNKNGVATGDKSPSKEERRAARKRAKKCKTPAEDYLNMVDDVAPTATDPDRPAVKRMGEIPPYVPYQDAFLDLSGGQFEGFKMPTLPSANCLISDPGYPSYFGKGLEDAAEEPASVNWPSDSSIKEQQGKIIGNKDDLKRLLGSGTGKPDLMAPVGSTVGTAGLALYNSVETHQPKGEVDWVTQPSGDEGFTNMFNDSADTVFNESFEYEFGGNGAEKAGAVSKTLPAPSLDDAWKPLTAAKTTTSFFKAPKAKKEVAPSEDMTETKKKIPETIKPHTAPVTEENVSELMRKQIQDMQRRFEDLEAKHRRDTKNEILLFVGTGLFVLLSLDVVARIARRY